MKTIRNVVAATDFSPASEAALRRAVQLAMSHGAALCVLHAFDVDAWHSLKGVFDVQRLTTDPTPDVRMRKRLTDRAAALAKETRLEVALHFGLGPPANAIAAYVGAHSDSLVVIGSRAEPTVSGLGSTASKVVRKPSCPVLIVRAAEDRPYTRILSAVDLREGSVRAASLAVDLFPVAHHHLLYALDSASGAVAWDGLRDASLQTLLASQHAQAEHGLQQLAQRLSAVATHPLEAVVADDVPARAILVAAANLGADCIVVGHHGQGVATDSSLGSMAQHVIHAALGDVLVVP